ncbi:MAG: prolyl aminopeptidase [Propionibacteriales bacterium]|nr:prolyl aminopeptidase [Propionibacteriales bacterium]
MTEARDLDEILYPPLEPYAHGRLDVGDGQLIYWEEAGNPDGKPVVFVHGGPGGGIIPAYRRYFDPTRYRVVLFDQRGCGHSLPHAAEPAADLSTNTTWHLVADMEKLREARGIESWQVFGGSWGSALALAYAETHPERVTELVLRGIFTLRRSEIDWYYNGGAAHLAPEWWEKFCAPLPDGFDGDRVAKFHELLFDPDPAVHLPAGVAWSTWEAATSSLEFSADHVADFAVPEFAVAFARIENHYFVNGGWMAEGQLLAEVDKIRHIPGVIVQGRYDLPCPVTTADALHRAWPEADYHVVLAGHAAGEPAIAAELVAATDRFAGR